MVFNAVATAAAWFSIGFSLLCLKHCSSSENDEQKIQKGRRTDDDYKFYWIIPPWTMWRLNPYQAKELGWPLRIKSFKSIRGLLMSSWGRR